MKDLFGQENPDYTKEWEEHWKNMPEYKQHCKEAIKSVNINFESIDDLHKFNDLTGLNITMQTKGAFFPVKSQKKVCYVKD